VVCGRADAEVIAGEDDIRREVEALWAFHEPRLRAGTPPRMLMDRVAFSEHPPLQIVRCRGCGLVYRNPVERGHELREIYARDTPAPDVLRTLHHTQRSAVRAQARRLLRVLGRRGSGLEVGSYVGAFLAAARELGLEFEGLDINAEVNAFTRELGFPVHDGELTSFEGSRTYDAVAIWNTFDQLADPRGVVNAAWRLLRPGGVLAIRVPNGAFYAAWRGRIDEHFLMRHSARELLAQNNLLGFPYRAGFTPDSLSRLLRETGFTVQRVRGDVLVPIGDAWTKGWARLEERLVKGALGALARTSLAWAPWFEIYARRDRDPA
jgi:SAM-dependent methyltransferase